MCADTYPTLPRLAQTFELLRPLTSSREDPLQICAVSLSVLRSDEGQAVGRPPDDATGRLSDQARHVEVEG